MQTSGTAPQFSDGVRKTITTKAPTLVRAAVNKRPAVVNKPPAAAHRSGGHAKHAKRGK